MADVFLSYARADAVQVGAIGGAVEQTGRSLWWDRRLAAGEDYGLAIERELEAAHCVVVAWSAAARDSLWVRAEANAALDAGKLVQLSLDQARLPLPFTMLNFIDFSDWGGSREQAPWPKLDGELAARLGEEQALAEQEGARRRPDPRGIRVLVGPERSLQGLGKMVWLGWAAIGIAVLLSLSVVLAARDLVSGDAFGVISVAALVGSLVVLGSCAWMTGRIEKASRR